MRGLLVLALLSSTYASGAVIQQVRVDLKCPAEHLRIVSTDQATITQSCVLLKANHPKDGPYEIRDAHSMELKESGHYEMGKIFPDAKKGSAATTEAGEEARRFLNALFNSLMAFKSEHGAYTTDLVELGFLPGADYSYSCGFKNVAHTSPTRPVDPTRSTSDDLRFIVGSAKKWHFKFKYIGKASKNDFPPSSAEAAFFTAACVFRGKEGLDVWTIDEKKNVKHVSADR